MSTSRQALFMLWMLFATTLTAQDELASARAAWKDTTRNVHGRLNALVTLFKLDSTLTPAQAAHWIIPQGEKGQSRAYMGQLGLATVVSAMRSAFRRRPTEALARLDTAIQLCRAAGYTAGVAKAEEAKGRLLDQYGQGERAVAYKLNALRGYEQLQDTVGMIDMHNDLAFIYGMQSDNVQSIEEYKGSLALWRGRNASEELDLVLRIAEAERSAGNFGAMRSWMDTAEVLVRERGAQDPEKILEWTRGDLLMTDHRCKEAAALFRSVLAAIERNKRNFAGQSWMRSQLAQAELCAGDRRAAVRLALSGLEMAKAHGLRKEQLDNLFPLATAYEQLGETALALKYFKRYHELLDSTVNTGTAASLASGRVRAEFEKQQLADSLAHASEMALRTAEAGHQRKLRNGASGVGIVLGALAVVLFMQRKRIKKALRRSDELLLNILPEEVAEELKNTGASEARHIEQATILFTDFKGFTEASEKLTPQELVAELNTCFKAFDGIITARGIEKIKTIGDAYMCAGGLPDPKSTSPADVVHAALEMQAFMSARKQERDAASLPAFEMRVGIHTGPVVAGIVGVKKFQYDIWGDTVNTASRMESSGEVGQVNISEATYALVKDVRGVNGERGLVNGRNTPEPQTLSPITNDHSPAFTSILCASAPQWQNDDQQLTPSLAFTFTPRGKVLAKGKGELEMYFVERN